MTHIVFYHMNQRTIFLFDCGYTHRHPSFFTSATTLSSQNVTTQESSKKSHTEQRMTPVWIFLVYTFTLVIAISLLFMYRRIKRSKFPFCEY